MPEITTEILGNPQFKRDYKISYVYLTGAMYKGIASKELVVIAKCAVKNPNA